MHRIIAMCFALMVFPAAQAVGQEEAVCILPKFTFEAGGVLENMKVGYVTFGKLNAAKDNAILVVPGPAATGTLPTP